MAVAMVTTDVIDFIAGADTSVATDADLIAATAVENSAAATPTTAAVATEGEATFTLVASFASEVTVVATFMAAATAAVVTN
jgi:hypothetical protein